MTELVQEKSTSTGDRALRIISAFSGIPVMVGGMSFGMLYGYPVLAGLSLAVGWGGVRYFASSQTDLNLPDQIKESIQNWKKPSWNKAAFILAGLAGYGISSAAIDLNQGAAECQQQFATEQAEIRKLPALNPDASIQIDVTLRNHFCSPSDIADKKAITVPFDNKPHRLECGLDNK
jgi:hypothetical protein